MSGFNSMSRTEDKNYRLSTSFSGNLESVDFSSFKIDFLERGKAKAQ